jgi:DNA-binding PadR family transcriptional regulator
MSRSTGLSAGEAVLGLVIEQPDHRFSLERRLQARFGTAQFSPTTAYSAVKRLEKDRYIRPVGIGQDGRNVIYEPTPAGVEHQRRWVRTPAKAPLLREELYAKIAFCQPRDLPCLIDMVYREEQVCISELDRVGERMIAEQGSAGPRPLAQDDWSELMDRGVVLSEADFWGGRITQLGHLRSYLEELREEAERRALAEHRRGLTEQRRGVAEHRRVA